MPLAMAQSGERNIIRRVTGQENTRRFLESLGFVEGSEVTVVTEAHGDIIVNIKDTRVAIGKSLAMKILV